PAYSTLQPAQSAVAVQQPAHSTAQPAYLTAQPAYSTAQPAHSTVQQPAYSTLQQAQSAVQPAHSTVQQPAHSTVQQPAHSFPSPAYSTLQQAQPAYSTAQPAYSTVQQPGHSSVQQAQSTVQQAQSAVQQPAHSTVQSSYSTVQPTQSSVQTVQSLVEQTWMIAAYQEQQAWKTWEVWQAQVSPEQLTWVPAAQQAWEAWEEWQAWVMLAQPSDQPVKPVKRQRKKADCLYIDELPQEYLQSTVGRCVLVDPSRRDLLFAMQEDSTIQKKQIYRYTKCQQRRETCVTKYRKILEQVKKADKEDIAALERTLGAGSFIKPGLALFKEYLAARAEVATKLTVFYNKTMSWQRDGATTFEVPLHRKLQFAVYIKRQQADDRLVKKLREKFKPEDSDLEPIFIMGDWSAPMTQFHEPIRGKGWRRLLKHAGFEVYLIDEYLTSKLCPNCNERLSNTHKVPNPRPWRRRIQPKVKCHGLLSCESRACGEFQGKYLREKRSDVKRRLWNRDLVGVLNFRHILQSLRETGIVPARFERGQPAEASTAPKPTKARKTTASTAPKTTARKPCKTTARKASTANLT
ncbi:hypothetical protein GGH96_005682, partial [Coemansia sp. RSA 1972]